MLSTRAFCTGAIFGAGAMYFFDPRMGNRRRVAIEDRLRRMSRQTAEAIDAGIRDLENRGQGAAHAVGHLLEPTATRQNRRRMRCGQRSAVGPSLKWAPGPRLLAATCGTALMANCLIRRTPSAVILGTLGFGLFTRALSGARGRVEIHRTMEIAAPIDRVFEFFSDPENYLRISDAVTNVEIFGDGHFAKDMTIAGVPVHFEERFVTCDKNRLIETRSEPQSAISYCKHLRFESLDDNRTRLHMHFGYHPAGGVLGHAVAAAFGIDPKSLLSDLLMRAKFFLETGRQPHDATACRRNKGRQSATSVHFQTQQRPPPRYVDERAQHEAPLYGPGAPTEDVHQPSVSGSSQQPSWPHASNPLPEPAEHPGNFPPAI